MAAHKYWRALALTAATPATLEISEFHLYNGTTRVDAAATLTASAAPSGALANLKDDNTGTGCYWASGGESVVLTWTFPTPQNVDGIVVGARTTIARWPTALQLHGGDVTTGTGPSPEYIEHQCYGIGRFVSATKTGILRPLPGNAHKPLKTKDLLICPGIGRVPFEVVKEVTPATTPTKRWKPKDVRTSRGMGRVPLEGVKEVPPAPPPKTYTPQWAKVRLERDIDGKVIREQWSDPVTGLGVFENIDENFTYTLTAIYPDSGMRAVIADRIKPEGYPE